LYTDGDARGATPAANTEEALLRAIKRYSEKDYKPPERGHLRYIPDEWEYSGPKGDTNAWCKIWTINERLCENDAASFRAYKRKALDAMILALKDLDADGYFGIGPQRELITLMIWLTDSPEALTWWGRSIKRLNPKTVYDRVVTEAPSWCKLKR
jgi:hypothetical protein